MPRKRPADEQDSAADLIALLLRDRQRRKSERKDSHASERHYKELCSMLLWKHSEAFGKLRGCRYWSQGAIASEQKHVGRVTDRRVYGGDALRHEHLFPRGQLIQKLFALPDPSPKEVRELLERLNIGVVMTLDEDARLKAEGNEADPWQRYRDAGVIAICRDVPAQDPETEAASRR